jgi:hypothetical protein
VWFVFDWNAWVLGRKLLAEYSLDAADKVIVLDSKLLLCSIQLVKSLRSSLHS